MTDKRPGLKFLIFALFCMVSAAWLIQVTGNYRFFASTDSYEVVLPDATGLHHTDSVHLAGVRVGRVQAIELERGQAIVTFNLDEEITPTDTWEVGVRWRNVIGQRYLYLYPVGGGEPLEPGGRIAAERARPAADIALFFERITPLLRAIDPEQQNIVLGALNEALSGKEERTRELVADLGSLTSTLATRDDEIRTIIAEGTALLDAYAQREEEIDSFLVDFADVSSTVAARNDELVAAVVDIAEVQRRLGDLLRANDANIGQLTTELDTITTVVGENRDYFEASVATLRDGLAAYMLVSRWGQWFNVRAVATSVHNPDGSLLFCEVETGDRCDVTNAGPDPRADGSEPPPPELKDSGGDGAQAQSAESADGLDAVAASALRNGPEAQGGSR